MSESESSSKTSGAGWPRLVRIGAVAALVLAVIAGAFYFVTMKPTTTVTAHFSSAVGVYEGSDVRVLGVRIGVITKIVPHVDNIEVTMSYDADYKVPANASALVIPPSIVSDRYVQLAPAYKDGPVMANHTDIPIARTLAPVELDDIYQSLSDLSLALGPTANNKSGPLNDLIKTSKQNLEGNGAKLGQTFQDLSKAAKTFADGRTDLFGTVRNLETFTKALAASDAQVSHFETQFATVTRSLADERASLALALKNLSTALTDINNFINSNQASIRTSVTSLKEVSSTLVSQKAALNEILQVAPVAVSNITHAFNPTTHLIDARGSLAGSAANGDTSDTPIVPGAPPHVK